MYVTIDLMSSNYGLNHILMQSKGITFFLFLSDTLYISFFVCFCVAMNPFLRDTKRLIKKLVNKVAEKYAIFKDPQLIIVGSMKEHTRVGEIDESDVVLLLNEKYKGQNYFKFDDEEQKIVVNGQKIIPKEIQEFVDQTGTFNVTKEGLN